MRKVLQCFVVALFLVTFLFHESKAQSPEGFVYQAEIRSKNGKLLQNKNIILEIKIIRVVHNNNQVVWSRTYSVRTDVYAMVSINIEDGYIPHYPPFSDIDWGNGPYYLNVRVKSGNTWWSSGPPVRLMSVPYALHANTAGTIIENDPLFFGHVASEITETDTSKWNHAWRWGNHADMGYLTHFNEIDPVFLAHPSFVINNTNITNWNTAFNWGDHAAVGYLTDVWDPSTFDHDGSHTNSV